MSTLRATNAGRIGSGTTVTLMEVLLKGWINFNGTGTVAIRDSYNVTSLTDGGTGTYTFNLTTAMADTNQGTLGTLGGVSNVCTIGLNTASQVSINSYTSNTAAAVDQSLEQGAVVGALSGE